MPTMTPAIASLENCERSYDLRVVTIFGTSRACSFQETGLRSERGAISHIQGESAEKKSGRHRVMSPRLARRARASWVNR